LHPDGGASQFTVNPSRSQFPTTLVVCQYGLGNFRFNIAFKGFIKHIMIFVLEALSEKGRSGSHIRRSLKNLQFQNESTQLLITLCSADQLAKLLAM
jgi:hypothetical protein